MTLTRSFDPVMSTKRGEESSSVVLWPSLPDSDSPKVYSSPDSFDKSLEIGDKIQIEQMNDKKGNKLI